ncbi:2',3'-cyclic-nucleotide 3'-phosphodiesterase [Corynascus novoguineensis]|uniref:2',3'-cyclic-nucleotide 3'-phosphodiesterase n=1 Tax=Corynascus novoguineensis TaxID=1126955 RepID=A0AAN7CTK5_9PEZI|nr:2',3'-cyclic-nucleotide 3'-phosphodiesterase [Corynascus novoguineensis]
MPGSSLWLLPPESHPLNPILKNHITTTLPAAFPREAASSPRVVPHFFPAHVTLTSAIPPEVYGDDPQGWLDRLPFPGGTETGTGTGKERRVKVRFERIASQDVFYRRCFVKVEFDGVREVAGVARAAGVLGEEVKVGADGEVSFGEETEKWLSSWREEFGPHLSLMYGNEPILDGALREVTKIVQQAGIKLRDETEEHGKDSDGLDGWDGGVIWLVPTDKSISEWGKPIATRKI